MKDVAEAAGVSLATVSSTLSGASYVSPALKERVTAAVTALGYERNSMASSLKSGRTSLIGLIVPDITNPFFTELIDNVQSQARTAGFSVLLGISEHDAECEAELLRLMRSHQARGTLLCPTGGIEDYGPARLQLGSMPLVAVDNVDSKMPFDTVAMDNGKAAALAALHILALGHRDIAVMVGPRHQFVSQQRLAGFVNQLEAAGLGFDVSLLCQGEFRLEEAFRSCRTLLQRSNVPTAIFVCNNLMLIGVMQAIAEAGLSVPYDISVVSIDDFPWATAFYPALTVVRQPVAEMATVSLSRLRQRMDGDRSESIHEVIIPEFVLRQSCAEPKRRLGQAASNSRANHRGPAATAT